MKILVANLGSTSFKYRLFDMDTEQQLARGGVERIGAEQSNCFVETGGNKTELILQVPDHSVAVRKCLEQLTDPEHGCLAEAGEVAAIGFKAVHGGRYSGVQKVTHEVLDAMEEMSGVAPAHNPPYISAMRQLAEKLPDIPLVAAFETGYHQTIPPRNRNYAIPREWAEQFYVKKWGFHGASHRYIAGRMGQILNRRNLRIISCHLGGSSSLCASLDGRSVATTMGMSPQSGLPHNNRVGDFDPFALPVIIKKSGLTLEKVLARLASDSGLAGVSGTSGDCRDLEQSAAAGNEDAQLGLDIFISETRRHLGGLLVELGGADAIVFTGGIGENGKEIRKSICANLSALGVELCDSANSTVDGETRISSEQSNVQIWVVPANEEIVVARQTKALVEGE
ncbi:MAG: acetate kinase [Planctomycetaceae bacterium]|nr:acetate kinase [Planctomycetaceae bacterium]